MRTNYQKIAAVMCDEPMTSREAAIRAGLHPIHGYRAMTLLVRNGLAVCADSTYPARYVRGEGEAIPEPREPSLTIVQMALRSSPVSVWALAERA